MGLFEFRRVPATPVSPGNAKRQEGFFEPHEAIKANLHMARALASLEMYLSQVGTGEPDKATIETITKDIPSKFKGRFGYFDKYFRKYQKETASARKCKQLLDINIEKTIREAHQGSEKNEMTHDVANNLFTRTHIFEPIVSSPAQGNMHCAMQGPYLFVTCEDPSDYARLAQVNTRDALIEKEWVSAACYVSKKELPIFEGQPVGVVVLNGSLPAELGIDLQLISDHEGQHFINQEVFDRFGAPEFAYEPKVLRLVKDELMGKVRDAVQPEYVADMPKQEPYRHLFVALDAGQGEIAREAIHALAEHMKKFGYFETRDRMRRAELAYRLMPIPLSQWPKWMEVLDKYHSRQNSDHKEERPPKRTLSSLFKRAA